MSRTRCSGRIRAPFCFATGEVVEVERVARVDRAADVALAEVHARALLDAVQVRARLRPLRVVVRVGLAVASSSSSNRTASSSGRNRFCQPRPWRRSCISFVRSGHCAGGTRFTSIIRPTSA